MFLMRRPLATAFRSLPSRRFVSTLGSNPHIKVFPNAAINNSHIFTLLETNPPSPRLAIGTSNENPPTPQSFQDNHDFLPILYDVLSKHAAQDPMLQAQAAAFAGPGGATLGSGGAFFPQQNKRRKGSAAGLGAGGGAGGGGGGGASAQGGAGGAGMGGHVHLSDLRNPPDFGRIAWPEDILGSIEVDSRGQIVGDFQPSGTYRIITNEGILGLSDFMRGKLIERLREEESRS